MMQAAEIPKESELLLQRSQKTWKCLRRMAASRIHDVVFAGNAMINPAGLVAEVMEPPQGFRWPCKRFGEARLLPGQSCGVSLE